MVDIPSEVRSRELKVMFLGAPLCLCGREKGAHFQKVGEEGQR